MCGIAGFIAFRDVQKVPFLQRASSLLAHRGPDDEGYLLINDAGETTEASGPDTKVPGIESRAVLAESLVSHSYRAGLVHRRLAILDTGPAGHQPMPDASRKVWISYNGEIYNYRNLRTELETSGFEFTTNGDTEVLLAAWKEWGPACLDKLDGMWAFALLDLKRQQFFAATDRAGIKPFYYRSGPDGYYFASEIKALFEDDFPPVLNEKEAAWFLAYGQSDESEQTLFKGIKRLQAGHFIQMNLNAEAVLAAKRWHGWQLNTVFENESDDKRQIGEIREMLDESIRLRLQSEVPLGLCLSGGIDSSAVAGLVSTCHHDQKLQFPAKAFMAVLPSGSQPDESDFARSMAKQAGLEFCSVSPDAQDFVSSLPDLMYSLEAPPPGMNAFSQYAVFRLVAQHGVKVTLDGQGADEIFAGYPAHLEEFLRECLLHGNFSGLPSGYLFAMLKNWLRQYFPASLERFLLLQTKPEFSVFRPEVLEMAGPKEKHHSAGLNSRLEHDFSSGILPFLLKAADRNSMRWSVESRMPFADTGLLIEKLFSIPGKAKIRMGISKFLLREAVKDLVPQEILFRRDKVGFAAPDVIWLQELIRSQYAKTLPDCSRFLNEEQLARWSAEFLTGPEKIDKSVLWRAWAFKIWYSVFFSGNLQFDKIPSMKLA